MVGRQMLANKRQTVRCGRDPDRSGSQGSGPPGKPGRKGGDYGGSASGGHHPVSNDLRKLPTGSRCPATAKTVIRNCNFARQSRSNKIAETQSLAIMVNIFDVESPVGQNISSGAKAALAAIALTVAAGPAAAKIYKTIDQDGNVVYTDVAPAQREGEAELQVEELNTYRSPEPAVLPTVKLSPDAPVLAPEEVFTYTELELSSPTADQAIRANNGNISLSANVLPALQDDHALRFFLDGTPVATVNGLTAALTAVDRGTHSARVAIVDRAGATIRESAAVEFHVLRYSIQNPNARPKP